MKIMVVLIFIFCIPSTSSSETLHVPDDFDKIQKAIDAAKNGDIILVAPDTYVENLDFKGKAVTVTSEHGPELTLIDGSQLAPVVTFENGEGFDSILCGFTLKNGGYFQGAGIYCSGTAPTIEYNIISENGAGAGGGIFCKENASPRVNRNSIIDNSAAFFAGGLLCVDSSPIIQHNLIAGNTVSANSFFDSNGGGIYCTNSSSLILSNVIKDNRAEASPFMFAFGGGIYLEDSSNPVIVNNFIFDNWADHEGGGIFCKDSSSPTISNNTLVGNSNNGIYCYTFTFPTITNTILWANLPGQIDGHGSPTVTYCDVQGGFPGTGNIDEDPLFVNPGIADFHLRYTSPCRDAGDNLAPGLLDEDFEGDPRLAYGTADIGADEFYTHLYYTGDASPGGTVEGKLLGVPGTTPVGLWFGSGVLDPPMPSMFGPWYLAYPWIGPIDLGSVPSPDGLILLSATLPPTPPAPYEIPMQALMGNELTNLCVLSVR